MKLSELRTAIRSCTAFPPSIKVEMSPGRYAWLPLQKTELLKALGTAFDDSRTAETHMEFDADTGQLTLPTQSAPDPLEDDDPLDLTPPSKPAAAFDLDDL